MSTPSQSTLSTKEFAELRKIILDLCGITLNDDKHYLVKTRLEPVLEKNRIGSYSELIDRLKRPNALILRDEIVEAITTNETSFNRDGHPYEEIRKTILPDLCRLATDRKKLSGLPFPRIRIWCAAASTGQEPYSVAMAVLDYLATQDGSSITADQFLILGSDISSKALQVARSGVYSPWEMDRGITPEQRIKHFAFDGKQWVISNEIRKLVEFRRLNLIERLPDLGGFDLVLCRNLLIYFDDATRLSVCEKLHANLNPEGWLLIGAAENLPPKAPFIQRFMGRSVAFRKA